MTELSTQKPASLAEAQPLPRAWVARVFERLNAQLGTKMADLYGGSTPELLQAEWAMGLAGYHEREIMRGLSKTAERVFAPTLGEFLQLCRPALNAEWAFFEAGDCLRQRDAGEVGDWSHPAVYRAACLMSPEVRSGDWKVNRTRWTYTLEREFSRGWGDEVPAPVKQLGHEPAKRRAPTDAERAALDALRSKFRQPVEGSAA